MILSAFVICSCAEAPRGTPFPDGGRPVDVGIRDVTPGSDAAATRIDAAARVDTLAHGADARQPDRSPAKPDQGTATACTTQCRYVRAGASGNASGSDWTHAYPALPATLQRGHVYYVADGSYPSYVANTPSSGQQPITIKKATATDHGTNTGWNSTYGDGQAIFGDITLITDYWVIDGRTRDESNWANGDAYGFRTPSFYSHSINHGHCADHVTIRYANVGGPQSATYNANQPTEAFYFGGFAEICEDWLISRVYAHNVGIVGQMAGVDGIVWEYSWLGLNWSKEILRGQIRASNVTIRHNILKDGCRDDHSPGTGCTAEIAFFANQGSANENYDGALIYGNVIWKTIGQHNSDACILIQDSDGGVIYNNTLVNNGPSGSCNLSLGNGLNSAIRNNIWYAPKMYNGCKATTCDNNSIYAVAPPFTNLAGGDFRLTAPLAGVALPGPYDTDRLGQTRGKDGTWDRGALEHVKP